MAGDLATVHAGEAAAHDAIRTALPKRNNHAWLAHAAAHVAQWTAREHSRYRQPLAAATSQA
jgi:hypothetical protein